MTTIERRRAIVKLYPGNYEQELSVLLDRAMEADRTEKVTSAKRMGSVSEAMALAKQYDDLLTEANASAVEVTVWALSYLQFGPLQDEHPPRDDEPDDKLRSVNMKTFPKALLCASLVSPEDSAGLGAVELQAKGQAALEGLGDISQVQYVKLENAAWNVNVGDDSLPKFSLELLLQQGNDPDSRPLSDSE